MSTDKKEIYYKFILPNKQYLTKKPADPYDKSQRGKVITLLNACENNVITYDELTSKNPAVKHYLDDYIAMPKYFNLRNYWDSTVSQAGGQSLMVSHTPEVNVDRLCWTKFESTYNGNKKVIYCSIIISSGNFFYNFNLPEEVLEKSGLRDNIVRYRFHENWYFTKDERNNYKDEHGNYIARVEVGREKRVFEQHYFQPGYTYTHANKVLFYDHFRDSSGNVYAPKDVQYKINHDGVTELQDYPFYTIEIDGTFHVKTTGIQVTHKRYETSQVESGYQGASNRYYITDGTKQLEVFPEKYCMTYKDVQEDLKKDFIDLEVTRRILYDYNDNVSQQNITKIKIPVKVTGTGTSAVIDLETSPNEYINHPPMPIKYNLLRSSLDNRDPYGDCETVLVMWVANKDPMGDDIVGITGEHGLRSLNWEQYAIPITVRCCIKNNDNQSNYTYSQNRFIVLYPHKYFHISSANTSYRFHTRCGLSYDKTKQDRVLYLRDLAQYSNDYIISYQHQEFAKQLNGKVNIQKYLLTKYAEQFEDVLYVRKQCEAPTNNLQQQNYYIPIPSAKYAINTSVDGGICFVKSKGSNIVLKPSEILLKSNFKDWSVNNLAWAINDDMFFALLKNTAMSGGTRIVNEVTGNMRIVNADELRKTLQSLTSLGYDADNSWNDIYISPFGILHDYNWYIDDSKDNRPPNGIAVVKPEGTPYSWYFSDAIIYGVHGHKFIPLDFLDGHIQISGTVYGSNKNNKIIVGFKNAFDYACKDYHHFHYNTNTDTYDLVISSTYNEASNTITYNLATDTTMPYQYTVYVVDYKP